MRSGFAHRGGLVLIKSPSERQLARRRRLMLICVFAAAAIGSGLIGSLTGPQQGSSQVSRVASAFSYFPSQ
jgi:hypothetical protein